MLVERDSIKENVIMNNIIESDPEQKKHHDLFRQEMDFKQQLINARKAQGLTQQDISRISELSQQAVSRLERKDGGTLDDISAAHS